MGRKVHGTGKFDGIAAASLGLPMLTPMVIHGIRLDQRALALQIPIMVTAEQTLVGCMCGWLAVCPKDDAKTTYRAHLPSA